MDTLPYYSNKIFSHKKLVGRKKKPELRNKVLTWARNHQIRGDDAETYNWVAQRPTLEYNLP